MTVSALGDLDGFFSREDGQGDTDAGEECCDGIGRVVFPSRELVAEIDYWSEQDDGITGRFSVFWVGGVGMGDDERSHAFTAPDDFGFWVLLLDEGGECVEVLIPFLWSVDVAASAGVGVISLSSGLGGVEGGRGEVFFDIGA